MEMIRRDTDYAIRGLLFLAKAPGRNSTCGQIGEACGIPRSFAHKILKRLADAGIVTSRTGCTGGGELRAGPACITLRHVVGTVQGPLSVSRCVTAPAVCGRSESCPLSVQWREIQDKIDGFLGSTTLQDLLASASESDALTT